MELSELRPIIKEAHRLGLKKIPGERRWLKTYMFYECIAHFYISNLELVYCNVPLSDRLNMMYAKFWKKYQEKFGAHDHHFRSLTMYLKEDK